MGALARTFQPVRFLPWRGIAVAGLLVALAASALALYAGSRHPMPPPFGPARNGSLLTSSANGDIVALDPTTGTVRPVLTGGGAGVTFSSTGQLFYFDKGAPGAPEIWIANADGSDSRKVWSGPASTTWIDWSQDGKHLVMADHPAAGGTTVHIVDAATGTDRTVTFDRSFTSVAEPFGSHTLLMVEEPDAEPSVYYLANDDGTNLRALGTTAPVGFPSLSGDGTRIAYASWQEGDGKQGRLHVLDLASGVDTAVASDPNILLSPVFSPDGTLIAAQRFASGATDYDIAIVDLDVSGAPIELGTTHDAAGGVGVSFSFSPDGTKLIARYADDSTAWLFDAKGSGGQRLAGITTEYFSWQRAGQ